MASASEDCSQFDCSKEEKDKLVAEVIRYVLFKTHQNSGCPIKREELTQIVTKSYRSRNLPAAVITEAQEKLSSVLGYELKELQRCRPSSASQRPSQQSTVEAKSYVLVSKLPAALYKKYVEDVDKVHLTGFTFLAIAIVHLGGGKISEEQLWSYLKRVGIQENDENHLEFGNTKQAVEALVHQRYLQKDKVNGPEGTTMFYELAERALDPIILEKSKEYIKQDPIILEKSKEYIKQLVKKDNMPEMSSDNDP